MSSGCDARRLLQPQAQLVGDVLMAGEAESANVFQIALSSALAHRKNVIRIPKAPPVHRPNTPIFQHDFSIGAACALQAAEGLYRVDMAERTAPSVPREDLLAKISWVGPQAPFVDTPVRTERSPSALHLQAAPAAKRTAVGALH